MKVINKKFHYGYLILNLINFKMYVGIRSCDVIPQEDKYMGSGKVLKLSIKKEGEENFKKFIIHEDENRENLLLWERNVVDREWVEDTYTYNLEIGGNGTTHCTKGTSAWNKGMARSKETKEKISSTLKKRYERLSEKERENMSIKSKKIRENMSTEEKEKISKKLKSKKNNLSVEEKEKISKKIKESVSKVSCPRFTGKKHSEETKRKIAESVRISKSKKSNQ